MADLKIASINVRGIGNDKERWETFNWLRNKKQSIFFLQEVHRTENNVDKWRAKWGYKALFSCCSGSSASICIVFNSNFNLDVIKSYFDPSGSFVICDIKIAEAFFTLANLYAPNEDNPDFFKLFLTIWTIFNAKK